MLDYSRRVSVCAWACAAASWVLVPALGHAAAIDLKTLQLTWHDEFDGTTLDATHWQAPTETRQGHSIWKPEQVSVADGNLRLGIHLGNDPIYRYECGAVRTQIDYDPNRTLFQQKFGYFETRCKLPQHIDADYWAAFWMMAGNVSDSVPDTRDGTEIDIMESFNYNWPREHVMAFHWNGYGEKHNSYGLSCGEQQQVLDHEFHTFGLSWDETWYIGYIDGVEVGRTKLIGLGSSADGKTLSQGTCLQPANLLLSCEAALWPGSSWSGWDANMPAEDEFLVDYVRVYSSVPEPTGLLAASVICGLLGLRRSRRHRGSGE